MLNLFLIFIFIFALLPSSCWRNLCLLVVIVGTYLNAGYGLVCAFHRLPYITFYFSTIVPHIQNRPSYSPFGGFGQG